MNMSAADPTGSAAVDQLGCGRSQTADQDGHNAQDRDADNPHDRDQRSVKRRSDLCELGDQAIGSVHAGHPADCRLDGGIGGKRE
jgi:hypothetical protein